MWLGKGKQFLTFPLRAGQNERIEELENEGHRSHAMEVLKANAVDLARRIDELRCVLVNLLRKITNN